MVKINRREFIKNTGISLVGLIGIVSSKTEEIRPKWKDCENIESRNPCGEILVSCYYNSCSFKKGCPYFFK